MIQTETSHFDVVIIGAGPAGLSIASELAKTHRVALIEKGTIGATDRAWFVPGEVMSRQDDEVQECFTHGIKRFFENTPSMTITWNAFCPWESSERLRCYPFIDSPKILGLWKKRALDQNALLLENCSFTDFYVENGIVANSTELSIRFL